MKCSVSMPSSLDNYRMCRDLLNTQECVFFKKGIWENRKRLKISNSECNQDLNL